MESRLRLADDLEARLADRADGLSTAISALQANVVYVSLENMGLFRSRDGGMVGLG